MVSVPPTIEQVILPDEVDFHKVETKSKDLKEVVYFYNKIKFAKVRSILTMRWIGTL